MTEIELKAHVANPEATERTIRGFAAFERETNKSDVYWKRETASPDGMSQSTIFAAIGAGISFIFAAAAAVAIIAGAHKETAIVVCLGGCALVSAITVSGAFIHRAGTHRAPTLPASPIPSETRATRLRVRAEAGETVVTYKRKELQGDIEVNDEREFSIGNRAAFETLIADLGFKPFITKEKKTKTFSYAAEGGTSVGIELSLVTGLGWFVELEILADNPDEAETARARAVLRETLAKCGIDPSAIESRYYTDMLASLTQGRP
jgi:predicted adenylyl cyclase CyaB